MKRRRLGRGVVNPYAAVLALGAASVVQFKYPTAGLGGVYTDLAGTIPVTNAGADTIAAVRDVVTGEIVAWQSEAARRPIWNNHAVFDGVNDYMILGDVWRRASTDVTTFYAAVDRTSESTSTLVSWLDQSVGTDRAYAIAQQTSGRAYAQTQGSIVQSAIGAFPLGRCVLAHRRNATEHRIYRDAVSAGSGVNTSTSTGPANPLIGAWYNNGALALYNAGIFEEVVSFHAFHDDATIANVGGILQGA